MAASSTLIANLALAHIGQERLDNLGSDDTTAALWAREFYPHARDYTTELNLWRYAKRTQTLAEVTNDRSSDYAYAYERPSDCLRLHHLLGPYGAFDPGAPIRFEVEGDTIYTDEYQARGVYCRQITDTAKFPPSVDSAMSWYLAHLLVQPLRLENALLATTLNGFRGAVDHAIATGSVEEVWIKTADEMMPDYLRYR